MIKFIFSLLAFVLFYNTVTFASDLSYKHKAKKDDYSFDALRAALHKERKKNRALKMAAANQESPNNEKKKTEKKKTKNKNKKNIRKSKIKYEKI